MSARRRLNIFHVESANHLDICSCTGMSVAWSLHFMASILELIICWLYRIIPSLRLAKNLFLFFKCCFSQVSRKPISCVHHKRQWKCLLTQGYWPHLVSILAENSCTLYPTRLLLTSPPLVLTPPPLVLQHWNQSQAHCLLESSKRDPVSFTSLSASARFMDAVW